MVVWNIIQTDKRPATAWDIMLDAALRPGLPPFPGQRAPFGSGVIGVKRKTLKEQGWYHTPAHRKWRKLVMQRDNWLCQECLRQGRITPATEAHHKIPLEERTDLALNVDNGEGLCWDCHELTKQRKKKEAVLPDGVRVIKA